MSFLKCLFTNTKMFLKMGRTILKKKYVGLIAIVTVLVTVLAFSFDFGYKASGTENINEESTKTIRQEITKLKSFDFCQNTFLVMKINNKTDTFILAKSVLDGNHTEKEEIITATEIIQDLSDFLEKNGEQSAYEMILGKVESEDWVYLEEEHYPIDRNSVTARDVQLPVSFLNQNPELPTGCEVTSLTTVLNYLGYKVSKETMADNYLPKCNFDEGTFWDYFIGDPRDEYAFGCYSSPIISAANSYLKNQKSKYRALDYSGSGFEIFLREVEAGNPIILWSTIDLADAFVTLGWEVNGQYVEWIAPEHCVTMIGYNLDRNTVTLSDPLVGIVEADMDTVYLRYRQMCSRAVVIKRDPGIKDEIETTTAQATTKAYENETSSKGGDSQEISNHESSNHESSTQEISTHETSTQETSAQEVTSHKGITQ